MKKYHLTPEQERLWFEWKKDPESRAYNVAFQLHIEGPLDLKLFKQAIISARRSIDSFKTYFIEEKEQVRQVVLTPEEITSQYSELPDFEYVDLTAKSASTTSHLREEAQKLIHTISQKKYVLTQYPLEHFALVKYASEHYFLVLASPHILCDASTNMIAFQLIAQNYNHNWMTPWLTWGYQQLGYMPGMEEYQNWLAKNYTEKEQKVDSEYWEKVLKEAQLQLDLRLPPLSSQVIQQRQESKEAKAMVERPNAKEERVTTPKKDATIAATQLTQENADLADRLCFTLEEKQWAKIKSLVQSEKTTLFVVLSTVFNAFLYRYFGQDDITLYYPSSMRPKGFEALTGFLANTLLLRTTFSPNLTFRQLIQQLSQQRLRDRAHRYYPYSRLVADLRKTVDHLSLPNVGIAQTAFSSHGISFKGLKVETTRPDSIHAMADFVLLYDEDSENNLLTLGFEYRQSLFTKPFIEQIKNHFLLLLTRMTENLDKPFAQSPLLSETEAKQILVEWNHPEQKYPQNQTLAQMFEEQVERTPQNTAIVFGNQRLTYRELNEKANQLAHLLIAQSQEMKPGTPMGICMKRSPELVVGILAILKAGGAYVSMDPHYAASRIQAIFTDIRPCLLLTEREVVSQLSDVGLSQDQMLVLDDETFQKQLGASQKKSNPQRSIRPSDLAYVIYTSGSTGKPKGVLQVHQTPVIFISAFQQRFPLKPTDVVLLHTSISFDVSVEEIFHTLSYGASLAIVPQTDHFDSDRTLQVMEQHHVTTAHVTPSMLGLLLEDPRFARVPLRYILAAGEALPPELIPIFYRTFPQAELHNVYGPTEATYSHSWRCEPQDTRSIVPIGKVIPGVQVYVLNDALQPVPVGVAGELYIGGATMARGYTNDALTRERFISNPFSSDPRSRLYKTGDLVRYLPDGNIEYLGRTDFQVKLRGVTNT